MSQFLSKERLRLLDRMFMSKPVSGKYHIPIGLNKLKLSKVEKRETKKPGLWMYIVEFKKDGEEVGFRNTKVYYKPVQCFHILTNRDDGEFEESWFRPFTNNLQEEGFLDLKHNVGEYFQALVKQREETTRLQDKKDKNIYRNLLLIKTEIVDIFSLDKEIEFNYFDLYVTEQPT